MRKPNYPCPRCGGTGKEVAGRKWLFVKQFKTCDLCRSTGEEHHYAHVVLYRYEQSYPLDAKTIPDNEVKETLEYFADHKCPWPIHRAGCEVVGSIDSFDSRAYMHWSDSDGNDDKRLTICGNVITASAWLERSAIEHNLGRPGELSALIGGRVYWLGDQFTGLVDSPKLVYWIGEPRQPRIAVDRACRNGRIQIGIETERRDRYQSTSLSPFMARKLARQLNDLSDQIQKREEQREQLESIDEAPKS